MNEQNGGVGKATPPTQDYVTGFGLAVQFTMPDMALFASGNFDLPNQAQDDIFELIYGGGFSLEPAKRLNLNRQKMRGLYALASMVITRPKMVLDDDDAVDGAYNAYRVLAWGDVLAAHAFFQYGVPGALPAATDTGAGNGTESPLPSDDVSQGTE